VDTKKLEQIPLFRGLSRKERERVARWADEIDVPAGYHLLDQGRFPHEFYVILEGSASVTRDGRPIAELGQGDFLGEIAIEHHDRRTATVVATTPLTAVVMRDREFSEMEREMPSVCEQVRRAIEERLGN
jgi:CRP-like cAMP-binding protein